MYSLLTITEFIGRFHPVVVHLPIGILLLAVIFHLLAYKEKFAMLQPAVKYSLLLGMLAAIASCISGFLLSQSGDYDEALVSKHQWFGIGLACVSVFTYFVIEKNLRLVKWLMPLIALLIIITGHLGGSLTHGEDYLTKPAVAKDSAGNVLMKPIPNVQQAIAYNDIVQPMLQARCYNCHGPAKQKGKLRLDEPSFIDKGGEDGKVIIASSAGESELIKRILLPLDNKDHMPPKEKPQLTKEQIELLNWWVNSGADYHKKVVELNQPEKIKPYLAALQSGSAVNELATSDVPEEKIGKAPDSIVNELRKLNVAVNNVSQGSNYLSVNFVAVDSVTAQHTQLLQQIGKQIAWLKLGNTKINDSLMSAVGKLPSLTKLFLNNSNATDKSLLYINKLSKLQYLNLSSTAVTAKGVNSLNSLKNLRQLYLYETGINAEGLASLKKILPSALIDTGGYTLQFLPTDTIIVKDKPKKS
jgi:uncharacterized membrane protein/mono/diheme cytochrome c family protein